MTIRPAQVAPFPLAQCSPTVSCFAIRSALSPRCLPPNLVAFQELIAYKFTQLSRILPPENQPILSLLWDMDVNFKNQLKSQQSEGEQTEALPC